MNTRGAGLAHEAIEQAVERRTSDLLATLGHELLNPLSAVRNAMTIMRLTEATDPTYQTARAISERQVDYVIDLVQGFLDAGRLGHGKIQLDKQKILLSDVVRRAVESNRPLLDGRQQSLIVALPPAPLHVDGDLIRLTQVVSNLLHNAIKYTPAGGQVTIRLQRVAGQAVLRVMDNGIGIGPALLPHVFELFRQASNGSGRQQSGLGIGLNVAARLVERHGGQIEATSAGEGQGAEFIVRLPVSAHAVPLSGGERLASQRRLLLVDDSFDAVETISALGELGGHEFNWTLNADVGVRLARELKPDVILLNVATAAIGDRLLRRLRDDAGARRPVMVGLSRDGAAGERCGAGFDHWVPKPADAQSWAGLMAMLVSPPATSVGRVAIAA